MKMAVILAIFLASNSSFAAEFRFLERSLLPEDSKAAIVDAIQSACSYVANQNGMIIEEATVVKADESGRPLTFYRTHLTVHPTDNDGMHPLPQYSVVIDSMRKQNKTIVTAIEGMNCR